MTRVEMQKALEGARKGYAYANTDAEAMRYSRRIEALEKALGIKN